jgi:hypothetical protein
MTNAPSSPISTIRDVKLTLSIDIVNWLFNVFTEAFSLSYREAGNPTPTHGRAEIWVSVPAKKYTKIILYALTWSNIWTLWTGLTLEQIVPLSSCIMQCNAMKCNACEIPIFKKCNRSIRTRKVSCSLIHSAFSMLHENIVDTFQLLYFIDFLWWSICCIWKLSRSRFQCIRS